MVKRARERHNGTRAAEANFMRNLMGLGLFCRRVVRSFYKTLDEPPEISVTMDKAGIDIQSKQSNGRTDWAGLVDYRANEFGILLYPQEGIFYWIPAHAEVEGGDWDKVLECAQANVDRRV
jgi:hypothetical protein